MNKLWQLKRPVFIIALDIAPVLVIMSGVYLKVTACCLYICRAARSTDCTHNQSLSTETGFTLLLISSKFDWKNDALLWFIVVLIKENIVACILGQQC